MKILSVEIINFKESHCINGNAVRRALYTGTFQCSGLPLHNKILNQISVTKVIRNNEYGTKEWGEPKTRFRLFGSETTFLTIEGLVTYYNHPEQFKPLNKASHKLLVSENGDVIVNGGQRRVYMVNGNKEVELGGKLYSVARLVALAFLGQPQSHNMVVQFADGNKENTHYPNLSYAAHKAGRPVKLSTQKQNKIRTLYTEGGTFKGLGREFGVSPRTIKRIVNE